MKIALTAVLLVAAVYGCKKDNGSPQPGLVYKMEGSRAWQGDSTVLDLNGGVTDSAYKVSFTTSVRVMNDSVIIFRADTFKLLSESGIAQLIFTDTLAAGTPQIVYTTASNSMTYTYYNTINSNGLLISENYSTQ